MGSAAEAECDGAGDVVGVAVGDGVGDDDAGGGDIVGDVVAGGDTVGRGEGEA